MSDNSRSGRPLAACGDAGVAAVRQCLAKDRTHGFIFHHNNVPVHTARMVIQLLDEYEWSVLEHPLIPLILLHVTSGYFQRRKITCVVTEEDFIFATKKAIWLLDKDPYVTAFDS
ncbi:hypothetical protein PoB_003810700 [Plakobranchus ocellatus]|uniref:Histone-lysine N-methyltransferase SETMAR n=1 Tax=Plakobranchus ocellatus TaxID=259542 RepID=A0AAV4AWF1_9GAST|nr:hypothetical protein PoB_003810700 [Plakobranchus ocellatus]